MPEGYIVHALCVIFWLLGMVAGYALGHGLTIRHFAKEYARVFQKE